MNLELNVYTKEQRHWCRNYQEQTGFEPLMSDFEHGNESFKEAAKTSVDWFENWASDALLFITDGEMTTIANSGQPD